MTTVTATAPKYVPACCYRAGDTLGHSTKDKATAWTFEFSDSCGEVSADGQANLATASELIGALEHGF